MISPAFAFGRTAPHYDAFALPQREALVALVARVTPYLPPHDPLVVDVGCGTGYLARMGLPWQIVGLDAAWGMCEQARAIMPRLAQAHATQLPFASAVADGVMSSLVWQWVADWQTAAVEAHRVLKPSGVFALSLYTQGTLCELDASFRAVGLRSPVLPFRRVPSLIETLHSAGFEVAECHTQPHLQALNNLFELLNYLRGLGATHTVREGLMTPRQLTAIAQHYHLHHTHPEGNAVVASWQLTQLIARRKA